MQSEDVAVKVRLEGETAQKFLELKELFGIVNNTEEGKSCVCYPFSYEDDEDH